MAGDLITEADFVYDHLRLMRQSGTLPGWRRADSSTVIVFQGCIAADQLLVQPHELDSYGGSRQGALPLNEQGAGRAMLWCMSSTGRAHTYPSGSEITYMAAEPMPGTHRREVNVCTAFRPVELESLQRGTAEAPTTFPGMRGPMGWVPGSRCRRIARWAG